VTKKRRNRFQAKYNGATTSRYCGCINSICVCGNAEKLLIQSHRSVALKIHFRPNAVAAAGGRKKEKENERKGEKLSFVETACDSRNGASYW